MKRQMLKTLCLFMLASASGVLSGCSAVRYQWRDVALASAPAGAGVLPKRLAIVGWAPKAAPDAAQTTQTEASDASVPHLGDVLSRVAADFIKLRRNYLVYDTGVVQKSFVEACRGKVEGVLLVRALDAKAQGAGKMHLDLSVELYACRDGALVWRVEGGATSAARVEDLAQLTDSYAGVLGESSRPYVAPSFALLQDLFGALPDVTLNDSEVEEKIELGMLHGHSAALASRHAL